MGRVEKKENRYPRRGSSKGKGKKKEDTYPRRGGGVGRAEKLDNITKKSMLSNIRELKKTPHNSSTRL